MRTNADAYSQLDFHSVQTETEEVVFVPESTLYVKKEGKTIGLYLEPDGERWTWMENTKRVEEVLGKTPFFVTKGDYMYTFYRIEWIADG